jgi:hypothetical protein
MTAVDDRLAAWAGSGAMALTGRADRPPLGPPWPLVERLVHVGEILASLGGGALPDPLALLGERAAISGLSRHGDVSCGGATRLLPASDGWIAVSMARPDDVAAVPAWLELDDGPADHWETIVRVVATRSATALVDRAGLLGLPVAELGQRGERGQRGQRGRSTDPLFDDLPVLASAYGAAKRAPTNAATVVDLTSLWAGPLCGHLLQLAGAQVVKVESSARPDGARRGPAAFFDLLNGGKESVVVDLASNDGIAALRRLLFAADVVIEASRPRALQQLGIDAPTLLTADAGPTVWISITGYGRDNGNATRVAFGDDAAAAGGLVVWDGAGPCFCADAIADPITGIVGAAAALRALASGRRWMIDVAMAGVAADLAGPTVAVPAAMRYQSPRARAVTTTAAPIGSDTRAVLAALAP